MDLISSRRKTRPVKAGRLIIGGDAPVSVQSMLNTSPHDFEASMAQIGRLTACGCDIVRITVPDAESAAVLARIRKSTDTVLVADIHFDYKLALAAIDAGVDKIRINPGNIGGDENAARVAYRAGEKGVAIRIGVNAGSLEKHIKEQHGSTSKALVESAMYHVALLERYDFKDIVISLKSSDVLKTIEAYRMISKMCDYPLHLGVTEAGTAFTAAIRSSVAMGTLLTDGIGDTIRVSVTGDPVEEVKIAKEILSSLDLRIFGPRIVSCPTCGRTRVNLIETAERVQQALSECNKNIKVAVMGCAVNGPGEARDADIGIAGGVGEYLLFKKGEPVCKVPAENAVERLMAEIEKL